MTSTTVKDLSIILTPSLFHAIVKNRMPWPRDKSLAFNAVSAYMFKNEPDGAEEFYRLCYPVLKHLSTLGISNIPDLMHYLPSPDSQDFPEQALGLQLLLDQGPRFLLDGINQRYTNSYFDIISLKYAKQLHHLPEAVRPDSKSRWMAELGASFDYFITVRFWFMAPFAHAEDMHCQKIMKGMVEESRLAVEERTGKTDPYRAMKGELDGDVNAFGRELSNFPSHPKCMMEEFVFWFLMLFDVHTPVIRAFGRYPYRNGALGRESTPKELEWVRENNHFGEVDAEVARKIREDVLAGRWTPLGES